jgi:hypothetical protein
LNTQLSAESAQLQAEINESDKEIKKLEQKWQDLKIEYDRAEVLLETARAELRSLANIGTSDNKKTVSLKETLNMQIREQENIFNKLRNVRYFYRFL